MAKDFDQDAIDRAAEQLHQELPFIDSYRFFRCLEHMVCAGAALEEAVTGVRLLFNLKQR